MWEQANVTYEVPVFSACVEHRARVSKVLGSPAVFVYLGRNGPQDVSKCLVPDMHQHCLRSLLETSESARADEVSEVIFGMRPSGYSDTNGVVVLSQNAFIAFVGPRLGA